MPDFFAIILFFNSQILGVLFLHFLLLFSNYAFKNLNSQTLTMNECNLSIIVLQYKRTFKHNRAMTSLAFHENNKLLIEELAWSLLGSNVLLIIRLSCGISSQREDPEPLFPPVCAGQRWLL